MPTPWDESCRRMRKRCFTSSSVREEVGSSRMSTLGFLMSGAIAEEAARRGANVTLVSGPVSITTTVPNINVIKVESAREMHEQCLKAFPNCSLGIMCAAVADYAPAEYVDTKIKREKDDIPVIKLVKNPDIAATLGEMKKESQMIVGFALETDNELENAIKKMYLKVHFICRT